ncbi:unnamed protein product [Ceutorhynchus assimilis]|uniref:Apple domain-containing protein n=1 Tax=Ceutorhynchus assimilis TaxID=467358 RepID=A0A9N9QNC2_9CUCU|nr:unnamed protein product [Ceutorhynchus assimilis]
MERFPSVLVWTLVISFVDCISIDGQLTVIRNDCYERMAIGEKLSAKQTYKTLAHNTVSKCEMECTQDKEKCRTYSFGIGPKGNASCLLGHNPVKETADLKPIGTISDTDYDLYIKKIDCQVVLEPPKHPTSSSDNRNPPAHSTHHAVNSNYGNLPAQSMYQGAVPNSGYLYQKPTETNHQVQHVQTHSTNHAVNSNYGISPAQSMYQGAVPNSGYLYQKPAETNHQVQHVQTLVSIASGPQSVLHPVHDILVSGDSYQHQQPPAAVAEYGDRPPFRPTALNHPYDDHRPQQEGYETTYRPSTIFDNSALRPNNYRPNTGSDNVDFSYRPQSQHTYDNPGLRPETSYRPNNDNYAIRPSTNTNFQTSYGQSSHNQFNNDRPDPTYGRPQNLPETGYGNGGTRISIDRRKYESYSSYAQFEHHSPNYNYYDHYDRPDPKYPNRYGSVIPHPDDYDRHDSHYDYLFVRPNAEPTYPGSDYDSQRPVKIGHSRPYGMQRPYGSDDGKKSGYERPYKPSKNPTTSSSKPPSTELTNHYNSMDYHKQYGKPGSYSNTKGSDKGQAIVTESVGYHGEKITSIITPLKNDRLPTFSPMSSPDDDITLQEIRKAIRQMKNQKSPGIYGIPAEFFKALGDDIT